ncbi:hypothetical protein BT96DRAFT_999672 [Gymnopus androsaceus JB14]|uniref:LysM domain-containing protein n=1 Tax=Gymnopus androsaceus JB14 TaxID=1447944 RepID=A0A6A4H4X1_9AGAR|nr:hypothetical protein BT96DRAFT_999672 [Gymnopus androsaceus JB14]
MQNDVEELHYNPFASPIAGRRRSLSSVSLNDDPSFAAFRSPSPSYASRPFLDLEGSNHARVRTETDTGSRNSQYHHPLRSAGLSTVFRDAGITRPHLTRVLDNGRLVDVSSAEDSEEDTGKNEVKTDEKVVIVHEVTSKDSLAGVALKYGINLTELRRFLYIPLEKSSPSQLHAAPIPSSNEPIPSRSSSQGPDRSSSSFENKVTTFSPPTIRRVPASELSFFPPPSKPSALAPSTPSPPALGQPSKSLHSRYATSPAPSLNYDLDSTAHSCLYKRYYHCEIIF